MRMLLLSLSLFPVLVLGADPVTLKEETIALPHYNHRVKLHKVTDTEHGRVCYVANQDGLGSTPTLACYDIDPAKKPATP